MDKVLKAVGNTGVIAIEPGDTVLILTDEIAVEAADRIKVQLREAFPGVKFYVAGGVHGAIVQKTNERRADDAPNHG